LQKVNISSIGEDLGKVEEALASDPSKIAISQEKSRGNHLMSEIIQNITSYNNREISLKQFFNHKVNDNIMKYKLENLKEIFEVLQSNPTVLERGNLNELGLPQNLVEKLVQPVLYIMNSREIEFNFQNFFLISNEIMEYILTGSS
jgi:hypothetical protein